MPRTAATRISKNSGAALLITLAALTLLLSLGSLSVMSMIAESRQANAWVHALRARLAAQAGLEMAIAELKRDAETRFVASQESPWFYRSAQQPSFAGVLQGGTRYVLNVQDAASRIAVNDANANLASMLENLPSLGPVLAARITARPNMPGGVYQTLSQLMKVPGIGPSVYDAVKDHLTLSAYQDPAVAGGPRCPINANTASREVLIAALQPLLSNAAEAGRVADDLIAARPMKDWAQYDAWVAALPSRVSTLSAAERRNLRDNMNPNRRNAWRKTNPNVAQAKVATEFCFHSGGIFRIESTGESLDRSGAVAAKAFVVCDARIFELACLSTKEQFLGEDANGNFVLEGSEDANANGRLDRSEFLNITWADDCPVDSRQETPMGYLGSYTRVNDALKLGFWDDFEDAAFSQAVWQNRETLLGSDFRIENSDTRNQAWEKINDMELHHSSRLAFPGSAAFAASRYGQLELGLLGGRAGTASGSPAVLPAWSFANAFLRADLIEDDAALRADPDSGCDDVGHLGFRAAASQRCEAHARYLGIASYQTAAAGAWRISTIYQNPLGGDNAWWSDAQNNPVDKDRQRFQSDPSVTVIREADESVLPRPLQPARVVATDGQTFKECTMLMPEHVVLRLGATPTPAGGGDGQGMGVQASGRTQYVLGNAANAYRYTPRRTLRLHTVNRQGPGGYLPGVRMALAQELGSGFIEEKSFPAGNEGSYYNSGGANTPYGFGGEINTDIAPEGKIVLQNHGSFPSWDNVRVISPMGKYQTPVFEARGANIRWGTLSWTLTIPASADYAKEKISFETKTFADALPAYAHGLYDWDESGLIRVQPGGAFDGNEVGSGQAVAETKGRITANESPVVGVSGARHGEPYLLLKAWLSSERYACNADEADPAKDDARFLKETPVLEDITVTWIPIARLRAYREGGA